MDIKTLATIATFLTSIVSLGTLWNATRQRLTANRPDIYIKKENYLMRFAQKNKMPKLVNRDGNEEFMLPIHNIGLGVAKKIQIKWKLDEEFVIKVKGLDKDNDYNINYEFPKKDSGSQFLVISSDSTGSVPNLKWDLLTEIEFLFPYKSDNEVNDLLKIPKSIIYLYGIYTELCYKHTKLEEWENAIFPVEISYKDVHNKLYTKKVKAKFSMVTIDPDDKEATGYVEFL